MCFLALREGKGVLAPLIGEKETYCRAQLATKLTLCSADCLWWTLIDWMFGYSVYVAMFGWTIHRFECISIPIECMLSPLWLECRPRKFYYICELRLRKSTIFNVSIGAAYYRCLYFGEFSFLGKCCYKGTCKTWGGKTNASCFCFVQYVLLLLWTNGG